MDDDAVQQWDIIERGSFAFAQCRMCGWLSPARRAYSSAHKEGAKHVATCTGVPEPAPLTHP